MNDQLQEILKRAKHDFYPIVPFQKGRDKLCTLDFSAANKSLTADIIRDNIALGIWIDTTIAAQGATYGIGGYLEDRVLYQRSKLFDGEEPRSIHLGIDIWGKAGTTVYAPLGGMVHSFAFNNEVGDYGATIIFQHQLNTYNFYTLYGHLSLADIGGIRSGQVFTRGEAFAQFGSPEENGQWPPHLHFQLIVDMGNFEGDYPGVCKPSELSSWVANSPEPSHLLNLD